MIGRETRVLLRHYLEQGMSKAAIARQLGVNRRTVHRWIAAGQLDRELDGEPSLPISVRHLVPLGLLKGAEVDGDGRGERYDDWYGCGRLGPGGRGA